MRLTIPNDTAKTPEQFLASKRAQREIQERASRIPRRHFGVFASTNFQGYPS